MHRSSHLLTEVAFLVIASSLSLSEAVGDDSFRDPLAFSESPFARSMNLYVYNLCESPLGHYLAG